MLIPNDNKLLKFKKISTETVINQLAAIKKGFPYAQLQKPAVIDDGIVALSADENVHYITLYEQHVSEGLDIAKFVPASGAATRMFKSLFEFIQASPEKQRQLIENEPYYSFINNIKKFAFFNDLNTVIGNDKTDQCKYVFNIISALLMEHGLNYGSLPKGLLMFHSGGESSITPFEEHIRETAKYCKTNKQTGKIHFTVSPEHQPKFQELMNRVIAKYEKQYNIKFLVDFSFQKPSTDTIAAHSDNTPFRDANGQLLFRPGGHGALIENLNDLTNDLVFIKNIDNVVPDHLQTDTVKYKKVLAGFLLEKKTIIFSILNKIDSPDSIIRQQGIDEGLLFLSNELQLDTPAGIMEQGQDEQIAYIKDRLNRPIRVCGMVKNEGEPGGGPFWVKQTDGSISLQIVEGAQIDPDDAVQQQILNSSTHFNPVDLVCYLKDYQNQKFNLHQFIDVNTGFISQKTQNGQPLKALELPGLWNGAMAKWITFFVEVPVSTFNPVKTVMDLLRPQHQPE